MAKSLFKIKEPYIGYDMEFLLIDEEELKVIEIQRKPSPPHVRRLSDSIRKIGFVVPLIVIKGEDGYTVIDGQHRLLAARELGIKEIPCVLIPDKFALELMELNIEKQMVLREKAYVALNVYRMYLEKDSDINERDIAPAIEFPYYVTLGLAYEMRERLYGSAYESIMRRVDRFIDEPLSSAMKTRERRASIVVDLDELIREAVRRVEEIGISHPFLHKEIVSFASPIGRKRIVLEEFEEIFDELRRRVEELIKNPELIREHEFAGEEE